LVSSGPQRTVRFCDWAMQVLAPLLTAVACLAATPGHAASSCPACAPKTRPTLDIVVPVFERDLCKLKISLRSWMWRDPEKIFGDVFVLWVSDTAMWPYSDDLAELRIMVEHFNKSFHLVDFAPLIAEAREELASDHRNDIYAIKGWYAQQVAKLKIATLIKNDFYVVMDAKNTLIVDLKPSALLSKCNQGMVSADFFWNKMPPPHGAWYRNAANLFHVNPQPHSRWPASISPFVLHRKTVLAALKEVGENASIAKLCQGPLCRLVGKVGDDARVTELSTYLMYANTKTDVDCTHSFYSVPSAVYGGTGTGVLNVWGAEGPSQGGLRREQAVDALASGVFRGIFFGFSHAALDDLPISKRHEIGSKAAQVYKRAGLYNFSSLEGCLSCIVGSRDATSTSKTSSTSTQTATTLTVTMMTETSTLTSSSTITSTGASTTASVPLQSAAWVSQAHSWNSGVIAVFTGSLVSVALVSGAIGVCIGRSARDIRTRDEPGSPSGQRLTTALQSP